MTSSFNLNLVSAGILFGLVQLALLCLLFYFKRDPAHRPYLVLFFTALLLVQLETFFNRVGLTARIPHILNTTTPLIFVLGPFIYLSVQQWLNKLVSTKTVLWHSVPFVLFFLYSFFFFLQPTEYKYNAFVNSFHPELSMLAVQKSFPVDPLNIRGIVVVELLSLHILAYAFLSFYELRNYFRESSARWPLFIIILLTIGGITLFMSQGGVINGARFLPSFIPTFSADLFPTVATYAVSIYLVLYGFPRDIKMSKYYKSGMASEVRTSKLASIIHTIEQQRLYTQPGFSLEQLSQTCNLTKHHVSQVINEEMGCTFFELVNTYRIRDAKKMLVESEPQVKMEQLAYDLGYRSKSTFFNAFKKATNLTPQKFRQTQSN